MTLPATQVLHLRRTTSPSSISSGTSATGTARHDHVVWKVRLDKAAEFDVYLDYACANDSAGNRFAIDGVEPAIRGKVAGTGGWDRYTLVKLGTVKLPAGPERDHSSARTAR